MPSIDLPLDQLWSYTPPPTEPADFAAFWERAIASAREIQLDLEFAPAPPPLAGVKAEQVWWNGLAGARISGWYVRPATGGPFPAVVQYHGYSGRGGRPLELYPLASQGLAVLSMDCRGQGGESPDIPSLDGGHRPGWLTRGLRDPENHYYRYVFADAVRAVDVVRSLDEVDASRVATTGASQGGGLALAAAALAGSVSFVWSDVPFLCDYRRAVALAPEPPYTEIADFVRRSPELEEQAFRSLSYFDMVNHAPRITCPARVTVGLWDTICPPSTIFAAFKRLGSSDKELVVRPYHGHDIDTYDIGVQRLTELVKRLGARAGD